MQRKQNKNLYKTEIKRGKKVHPKNFTYLNFSHLENTVALFFVLSTLSGIFMPAAIATLTGYYFSMSVRSNLECDAKQIQVSPIAICFDYS